MKFNKVLIIAILIITITLLIVSFETQEKFANNRKIDIPKVVIPKITTSKEPIQREDDELSRIVSDLESIVEEDTNQMEEKKPTEDEIQNILSDLKFIVEEDTKDIEQNKPTEDEVQNILAKLEVLKPIEERREIVKKIEAPIRRKNIKKKRVISKKKRVVIKKRETKKHIKKEPCIEEKLSTLTAEEYRRELARESKIDEDIASLSMVETVDMDIEQKIEKGEVKELTTFKPIVRQEVIVIPSNQQIDDNIPWADLKDIDEKTEGIFIKEYIN